MQMFVSLQDYSILMKFWMLVLNFSGDPNLVLDPVTLNGCVNSVRTVFQVSRSYSEHYYYILIFLSDFMFLYCFLTLAVFCSFSL